MLVHHILSLFHAVRLACHVEQYCLVGQSVDHGGDQDLVIDDLVPAVESQICGDHGSLLVSPQGKMIEEHLRAGLVAGYITELVTYDHVVSLELVFQRAECQSIAALADLRQQSGHGGEQHGVSGIACCYPKSRGQMRLARAGIAVKN